MHARARLPAQAADDAASNAASQERFAILGRHDALDQRICSI
jgi:hypothetical protein